MCIICHVHAIIVALDTNMKPYGLSPKIPGGRPWKIDWRIRRNNRKIGNWWEEDCHHLISRRTMKQKWQRNMENEA